MQQHKAGQHKLYSDSVNDTLRAYAISIGVTRLRATQRIGPVGFQREKGWSLVDKPFLSGALWSHQGLFNPHRPVTAV